jgi:hypothetical protein
MSGTRAWHDRNQAALDSALSRLKALLRGETPPPLPEIADSALAHLTEAFDLSPFERDILLLCAGMELDGEVPELCARVQGDAARGFPSFALALAMLPEAHWSALAPDAPLRAWRLVEMDAGPLLTRARLRIDERVLHFLTGLQQMDERLATLLEKLPPAPPNELPPSLGGLTAQVAKAWANGPQGREMLLVQLCGPAANVRLAAACAAAQLGLVAANLPASRLPSGAAELEALIRLWERESVFSGLGVLLVDCEDDAPEGEAAQLRDAAIARLAERLGGPVILRERSPRRIATRPTLVLDVPAPAPTEQLALWQAALGAAAPEGTELAALAAQFNLSPAAIKAAAAEFSASPPASPGALWQLCRQRLRGALDGLAERIESQQGWDDLVLPPAQMDVLHSIAAQLRQRARVYDEWGFAAKSRRGLGLSALFHGPSGTGKTMAAEVLAGELKLDLYHIDLSRIVSKYIGETEKNLRRVFDAAEENGAILLFDEADSLFGKRSEVKDSHDRYANIEVSYLLQRMEAYRGLAILTTNQRGAIDPAFLRRIRFTIAFPFPDEAQRARIWAQIFPAAAPVEGLDWARLSQLRLAGGNIRNIALNAAFIAADEGEKVRMKHVRQAAKAEYEKLERRPAQSEEAAWA